MPTEITVVCPNCRNRMRASSDYIGRKGRCPACRALVEITLSGADQSLATLRPTHATRRGRAARPDSTAAPGWLSGIVGASVAALLSLVIFYPLRNTELGKLFLARGPMPYFITLCTCWGLAGLALKYFAIQKQRSYAELELDFIPLVIGVQITPSNVDQFLEHLRGLPDAPRRSVLGRRIQGALEHFKSRLSVPEVQQYLATQAEIDASGVDSGYTLLRAFIWAIPILGFIGTVMGISDAVSGLNASIASGGGAGEQLMAGLGTVTSGLAVAFDTTLIALALAILLLFPTETFRKIEYAMLDRIEAFTNESLLRRMADEQEPVKTEDLPQIVRDCLNAAFQEHQRWLAQWQAQVGRLGEEIGRDFEAAFKRVQEQIARDDSPQIQRLEQLDHRLEAVFQKLDEATQKWQPPRQGSEQLLAAIGQLQGSFRENTERLGQFADRLERALLARLGGGTEAIEWLGPAEETPNGPPQTEEKKRGWFGFRRNKS